MGYALSNFTVSYRDSVPGRRVDSCGQLHCCLILRNCDTPPSAPPTPIHQQHHGGKTLYPTRVTTHGRLRWQLAVFNRKELFRLRYAPFSATILLHTAPPSVRTTSHAQGKQKIHVACFILTFAFSKGSGTEPYVSPRCACKFHPKVNHKGSDQRNATLNTTKKEGIPGGPWRERSYPLPGA